MFTTTLKLADELKERIGAAAADAGVTPHAFMVASIERQTELALRWRAFVGDAARVACSNVSTSRPLARTRASACSTMSDPIRWRGKKSAAMLRHFLAYFFDFQSAVRHIWRMQTLSDLALLLRTERTRQQLSQAELAARAGIAFRSYQRLEAGEPGSRLSTLLRACAALGLELGASSAHRPTLDELAAIYGHESAT